MSEAFDVKVRRVAACLVERGIVHMQIEGHSESRAIRACANGIAEKPPHLHQRAFGSTLARLWGGEPSAAEMREIGREMGSYVRGLIARETH